jgi:branched-chain amino acid transport system ATP-binding protein
MSDPLLKIEHIDAFYGTIQALHDVSLEIYPQEIVTLIGANGAGKTTLMMSVFSQPRIRSGQILFKNQPIHHLPTHEIAQRGITIAPEGRRIFPKMTIEENLQLGYFAQSQAEYKVLRDRVFDLFPILRERRTCSAGTLSGGEQQMLAMGRSLMSKPTLFLLDEPSLGLAPQMVQKIFHVLQEIAADGATIFLVEQNAYMALQIAQRGYVMVNGEIQMSGKADALLKDEAVQKAYLGI